MSSRDKILSRLRAVRPPFPGAPEPPVEYLSVTALGDTTMEALLTRFKSEWEALKGTITIPPDPSGAIQAILTLVGDTKRIMAWEPLPLPGLQEALLDHGIELLNPNVRTKDRRMTYTQLDTIPMGITGVDAAFATTGTLVLKTGDGQGRLPSLLPPIHLALLRRERLFPHLEAWLASEGRDTIRDSRSIVFISGPSKTGDIEMQIIYGVHGPKNVHVIIL